MMSMNLSDITILNIKGSDCHCNISGISKNEAKNLMQKTNLTERRTKLQSIKIYHSILKWVKIFNLSDIEIEINKLYRHKTHVPQ